MLTNQVLQKVASDIAEISGAKCTIWGMNAHCLVGGEGYSRQERVQEVLKQYMDDPEAELPEGFFVAMDEDEPVYLLVLEGETENLALSGRFGVSQLENLLHAYKERLDRNSFVQNLLLDNLLMVDVYNQAKKLRIPIEEHRAVFIVEPKNENDNLVLETMRGLYATGTKDFVTAVDEGHIILLKTLEPTESYESLHHTAESIVDTLNMEAMVSVRVAYGTVVDELRFVSKSYKEAGMALDVGRIFYPERNILAYNKLGIGRLIHQLPVSLCEMFLREVFEGLNVESFDEETLSTVNQFFENNLNISETARQLYLHRNTLVYRLEKIQKTTGLDVRKFEDALTFKIALMVAKHMKFLQTDD